jgi:hypothetical protein
MERATHGVFPVANRMIIPEAAVFRLAGLAGATPCLFQVQSCRAMSHPPLRNRLLRHPRSFGVRVPDARLHGEVRARSARHELGPHGEPREPMARHCAERGSRRGVWYGRGGPARLGRLVRDPGGMLGRSGQASNGCRHASGRRWPGITDGVKLSSFCPGSPSIGGGVNGVAMRSIGAGDSIGDGSSNRSDLSLGLGLLVA